MFTVRKSIERGHASHGWLDSYHTFSFAEYYDPKHNGYRALRVINEDRVSPGEGFGAHGHKDMEIVTVVLEGALEHKDSLGNGAVLRPSELQRMSAGSGIQHSEFNPSKTEPVHFYQIWLHPEKNGLEPSYEQKAFSAESKRNRLCLVASQEAADGSLRINQDAKLYLANLDGGQGVRHSLKPGRGAWVQILRGSVEINGLSLNAGDAVAVDKETAFRINAESDAEVLLFDLA